MKRGGIIATVVFALLALGVGFGGTTAALLVTQPANPGSTTVVQFTVGANDTFADVAQRLQDAGLIRNVVAFKLLAKVRHLDTGVEQGAYELSPGMSMEQILSTLQTGGKADEVLAGVNEGLRVTEYADGFQNLPNFRADEFLQIAKTGIEPDGTKLWEKYWFVMQPSKKVAYALEGYLYPDHYNFARKATATDVVERMLNEFGWHLCPGPDATPFTYLFDQAQCKAHAATTKVGSNDVSVFTVLEQHYVAKDDSLSIYQALTLASIAMRELPRIEDARGIDTVLYNRYLGFQQKIPHDTGSELQADPTVQYAVTSDKAPTNGKWWPNLNAVDLTQVAVKNPYNTYLFPGLPPGPIAAPLWDVFMGAANPIPGPPYYLYYLNAKCAPHKTYYAANNNDFNTLKARYLDPSIKCP
jgi:UPF0755 protein